MGTTVLESSKNKKNKKESESWRKKEKMRALVGTFLNEREKERKEVGDKEIRTNVDRGENQEKKKEKKHMVESEMKKGKII